MADENIYAERDIEGDELRPHYMRHLDRMTRERLDSKSDIAAELAHRDLLLAQVKEPGHTDNADGSVTIRLATRSNQLESIAEGVDGMIGQYGSDNGVIMPPDDAHKITGWMEQLRIIAAELKKAGK